MQCYPSEKYLLRSAEDLSKAAVLWLIYAHLQQAEEMSLMLHNCIFGGQKLVHLCIYLQGDSC